MQMTRCAKCMKELAEGDLVCPGCGYEQDSAVQPPSALKWETILHGRYYIGNVIGQGGFGITYVGFDLVLETKVAVKEYFPSGSASRTSSYSNEIQWDFTGKGRESWEEGIDRFLREARKMARLDSVPAIVRVRDAFAENRTAYIVMDFVEGDTLKKYLQSHGVLDYEACITLLSPILDSLAVIHDCGFIHRDISPDNIMLQPDGSARLLDMGAAVDVRANEGRASMAVVKRNFSAPEQYMESESLGSWTDVYAMGATIYYCVTGKTVPEALERGLKKIPLSFDPELHIPLQVTEALNDALKLDAGKRIRDMRELKRRLIAAGEPASGQGGPAPSQQSPVPPLEYDDGMKTTPYTGNVPQTDSGPSADMDGGTGRTAPGGQKTGSKRVVAAIGVLSTLIVLFAVFMVAGPSRRAVSNAGEERDARAVAAGQPAVRETAAVAEDQSPVQETAAAAEDQSLGRETTAAEETIPASRYADVELSELTYYKTEDGNGITLSEYMGEGEAYIKLPDEIDGLPVVGLGANLFWNNKTLEGVILPEGLQYIGDGAFRGCYYLKQIELPQGVKTIGQSAFHDCYSLKQIGLSENLETIGEFTFANCSNLKRIELPEGLKSIEHRAFYCTGLQEITIPSTVESLSAGSSIFEIPQVKIADGNQIFSMVDGVIYKNGGELTAFPLSRDGEFTIPPEINTIGDYAFADTSMTELVIPGSVRAVGYGAFHSSSLQKVLIEDGVEKLGEYCFRNCGSLSEVTIPGSVTWIGSMAFADCDNLESVTISGNCQVQLRAFEPFTEIRYYD